MSEIDVEIVEIDELVEVEEEVIEEIVEKTTPPNPLEGIIGDLVADDQYHYTGQGFSHKLPTGLPPFDIALGGGIPLGGCIIEIWGEESHGKTTFTYRICKRATDMGGYVTWIDNESSYDDGWATVQGLNTKAVIAYRPPYMEKAIEIVLEDLRKYKARFLPWLDNPKWKPSKEQADAAGIGISNVAAIKEYMKEVAPPHLLIWDTLASCPVKTQVDGNDFGSGMAYRARLIKSFISRYGVEVDGCDKVGMIIINQVIDNIGDEWNPITTPGGRGLRHGKHLSIYVKKSGKGERDEMGVQSTDYVMLSITKNKVTPIISSFPVIFSKSKGFVGATSLLEYLMNIKWFRDAGSWKKFTYRHTDPDTGEVIEEEMSIQRGTFYKLINDRPEIFLYLAEQLKQQFVGRFPFNRALQEVDVLPIVEACRNEKTAMPDEGEESAVGVRN